MFKSHIKTLFRLPQLVTSTRSTPFISPRFTPFTSTRFIPFKLIRTKSSQAPKPSEESDPFGVPYIGLLDYPGIGPFRFDTNFKDITPENVSKDFSKILNSNYLSDVNNNEPLHKVNGKLFGTDGRPIISLIVVSEITGIRKYVHFILDTTSPYTYMTQEAFEAFGQGEYEFNIGCEINGKHVRIYKSNGNFSHVNILGINYLIRHKIDLIMKPRQREFTLVYP